MNTIVTLIASIVFSLLFYNKHIGLNMLIFSLVTILFLVFNNSEKVKTRPVLILIISYISTAIFVFLHCTSLSILANCIAFFTLVGVFSNQKTSIYIQWLNGIYTSIAGFFHRNIDENHNFKFKQKNDIDWFHWFKLIIIPLVFVFAFILLYRNGNPMFSDWVSKINFEFINLQWVLFTVLGYFLFSNISSPIRVEPATSKDLKIGNLLKKPEISSFENLKKETQLGTTLLVLLNSLIILYLITDILYVIKMDTKHASVLSSQVHNGINTLIASIIIAIIIIIYFFRGNLNFYNKTKVLKGLTYLWIVLNTILILLIAIKNQHYISSFGLTYKRIGVHIYLFLACIGLITTLIKVLHIKNLVFLFRRNTQIAFAILLLSSSINWDILITKYNLKHANDFDIDYLIRLSPTNAPILYELANTIDLSNKDKLRINSKYKSYLKDLRNKTWQEFTLDSFKQEQ